MPTKEEMREFVKEIFGEEAAADDVIVDWYVEVNKTAYQEYSDQQNATLIKECEELRKEIHRLCKYNQEQDDIISEQNNELQQKEREIKELKEALEKEVIAFGEWCNKNYEAIMNDYWIRRDGEYFQATTKQLYSLFASEALKQKDPRDNPLTDDDDWIHDIEMGDR